MASKFDKAKSAQSIKDVAMVSNTQAQVAKVVMISADKIIPNPDNDEDVSYTVDIETSIKKFGFTYHLHVFKIEEDKYMLLAGHRSFEAGLRLKLTEFPCIVKDIKEEDREEYMLAGNMGRHGDIDPMYFIKKIRKWKRVLEKNGFKGSGLKDELCNRTGFSKASVDRFLQAEHLVAPILELYRQGKVGLSSCTDTGLYTHSKEEQLAIFEIMNECLESGSVLSRDTVKLIVNKYRAGKRTWLEVIQVEMDEAQPFMNAPQGVSVINVNAEPAEQKEAQGSPLDRNNEVNYDYSHREGLESGVDPYEGERLNEDDMAAIEKAKQNGKGEKTPPLTEEEKRLKTGKDIVSYADKLSGLLGAFYDFESEETRLNAMECLRGLMKDILAELNRMVDDGERQQEVFAKALKELENDIKFYKNN